MAGVTSKKQLKHRRHSKLCPCNEDILVQSQYFSKLIKKISNLSEVKRSEILKNADPCFIRYLEKCAKGILKTHIKLYKGKYKELSKDKNLLLKLANPNISLNSKRQQLIHQKGGFLGILAGIAGAAITELLSQGIKRFI